MYQHPTRERRKPEIATFSIALQKDILGNRILGKSIEGTFLEGLSELSLPLVRFHLEVVIRGQ